MNWIAGILGMMMFFTPAWKPRVTVVSVEGSHASMVEQSKTLNKFCPEVQIIAARDYADYVVEWTTKTWAETSWSGKMNEYAILPAQRRPGDVGIR